jgi:hypothetical protein
MVPYGELVDNKTLASALYHHFPRYSKAYTCILQYLHSRYLYLVMASQLDACVITMTVHDATWGSQIEGHAKLRHPWT